MRQRRDRESNDPGRPVAGRAGASRTTTRTNARRSPTSPHGDASTRRREPGPRIRELPGPRQQKGIIAPTFRVIFAWPYRLALAGLYRAGFRPWQLTVLSLAANAVCSWVIATGRLFLPGTQRL